MSLNFLGKIQQLKIFSKLKAASCNTQLDVISRFCIPVRVQEILSNKQDIQHMGREIFKFSNIDILRTRYDKFLIINLRSACSWVGFSFQIHSGCPKERLFISQLPRTVFTQLGFFFN